MYTLYIYGSSYIDTCILIYRYTDIPTVYHRIYTLHIWCLDVSILVYRYTDIPIVYFRICILYIYGAYSVWICRYLYTGIPTHILDTTHLTWNTWPEYTTFLYINLGAILVYRFIALCFHEVNIYSRGFV